MTENKPFTQISSSELCVVYSYCYLSVEYTSHAMGYMAWAIIIKIRATSEIKKKAKRFTRDFKMF